VGLDGSEAAWLLVQHAVLDTEFMDKCLPLLLHPTLNHINQTNLFYVKRKKTFQAR